MLKLICLCAFALAVAASMSVAQAASPDTRFYEMRVYYAAPGKLDDMHARFRNHTIKLFEKHGMTNIGYWVPLENPDSKLVYVLAYPSKEAREKSWQAFLNDPDWKAAKAASEVNGKLVDKIESIYLKAVDYSPAIKASKGAEERVFELRTYTSAPGKLDALHARFRDHTVNLFTKHGMTNIGYWTPVDQDKGADNTLIYFLAHKSRESAREGFRAFAQDPAWTAARTASEKDGPLTAKGGVKSEFMKPTDYSPTK